LAAVITPESISTVMIVASGMKRARHHCGRSDRPGHSRAHAQARQRLGCRRFELNDVGQWVSDRRS